MVPPRCPGGAGRRGMPQRAPAEAMYLMIALGVLLVSLTVTLVLGVALWALGGVSALGAVLVTWLGIGPCVILFLFLLRCRQGHRRARMRRGGAGADAVQSRW